MRTVAVAVTPIKYIKLSSCRCCSVECIISAAVAVTPSIASAVVDVVTNSSSILSSAVVDVIPSSVISAARFHQVC